MLIRQTWHSDRVMWMTVIFVPLRATQRARWVTTLVKLTSVLAPWIGPKAGKQQSLGAGPEPCFSTTSVLPRKLLNFFKGWVSYLFNERFFFRCCNFSHLLGTGRW